MFRVGQAWKKRVEGAFVGTFLNSISGRIVYKVYRERIRAISCLQGNGKAAWDREFDTEELDQYFPYGGAIYTGGSAARRLDVETGNTLAERELAGSVTVRPPISSGPVYEGPASLLGLHPLTLETVWELPNPNYMAHDDQLCRYEEDEGQIRLVDLRTLQERRVPWPAKAKPFGPHGHCGELWCQFAGPERFGISMTSGDVVWHHEESEVDLHGVWPGDVVFTRDVAYCGGRALSAYDLKIGQLLWRREVSGNPGRLRVEGGRVYAGTKSGLVYVLDAATGDVLLSHDLKVEPTAVAPLGPDRIVVGTYKVIYCLEIT